MKWPIWKDFGWPDACMGPCRTVPAIPGEVQGALGKWHSIGAVLWEAGSSGGRISVNICSSSNCPVLRCWLFRAALRFAAGLGLAFNSHRPLSTTEVSRDYKILPKDWKIPEKHLSGSSLYAAFFPPFPRKGIREVTCYETGVPFPEFTSGFMFSFFQWWQLRTEDVQYCGKLFLTKSQCVFSALITVNGNGYLQ